MNPIEIFVLIIAIIMLSITVPAIFAGKVFPVAERFIRRARDRRPASILAVGELDGVAIEVKFTPIMVDQPMSERVLVLMQRARHPMTAGMVMRRLYRWEKRNFFLFQLVRSNLEALVRDGSADSWKSARGNSVYQVHA
ncbi:MAG: hypothetical protein WCV69_03545 [Patescibacteria group bacterium]|jgi:hypothetical protein